MYVSTSKTHDTSPGQVERSSRARTPRSACDASIVKVAGRSVMLFAFLLLTSGLWACADEASRGSVIEVGDCTSSPECVQDTGAQDTRVQDTGAQDTGAQDTGAQDTGIQDTGIQDTGAQDTRVQDTGPPPDLVGIAITPADPLITVINGTAAPVDFDIEGTYSDGSTALIASGAWLIEGLPLGEISEASGEFAASGELAGTATVQVEVSSGQIATTTVRVAIEVVILGDDAPLDAADRFAGAPVTDPIRAAGLLYPLDGTIFPQNVFPPDIQWERGAAGDLYRVQLGSQSVSLTTYVVHSGDTFRYDWMVDRVAWRKLAESSPEEPVTLRVDRWESASGEMIEGSPRSFQFAAATILGAIYYWDLAGGRIQRIRGDGQGLESFMPNPPARPADGRRCVACHAISRDGTRMAAELWDGADYGAIFDLTADLSVDPAPTLVPPSVSRFLTASFSPDNQRLVANEGNRLYLMDGNSGAELPAGGAGLPTTGSAHPTWSPDGASIAYAANHNGPWGVDFSSSALGLISVTAPDTFGAPTTVFDPATAGRPYPVTARPSWSPDSLWLAIQNSQHSRAFEGGALREGVILLIDPSTGLAFDLAALNNGDVHNYYPTFSPFDEGGYFWLAFFSTRDYGNAQAGTRGTSRRQLWVSAISNNPQAGVDPSHAPYWLPQQDLAQDNMAAFWSEDPCRADGRSCGGSGECCSGFCRDQGQGQICVPGDVVECSELDEPCQIDANCCAGAGLCVGGICTFL